MIKKLLYCLSSVLFAFSLHAQENANIPYSSNGIGILNSDNRLIYSPIGNTLTSAIDSIALNFYNPSSYSSISKGQPIFSIGVDNTLHSFTDNNITEKGSYTQINHFVFGVSFAKIVGFAFGIRPFSRSSYNFSELIPLDTSSNMRQDYKGKGNSTLFFTGFSVTALNLKHHKLGVGMNLGYLFGSLENTQTAYIDNGAVINAGVMYSTIHYLSSFHYDLGLNYQFLLEKDRIIVGASFTPKQNLKSTHIYEKAYATDLEDKNSYGYILSDQQKGKITLPASLSVGIQYVLNTRKKNQNAKLNSRISFSAEYRANMWKEYDERFSTNTIAYDYRNTSTYSFGIEYVPQQLFLERVTTGYLSKVRYRVGTSFGQLPYSLNGNYMNKQSYVVGFGFPFVMMRSIASINFSVGYTNQTIKNTPSYNENFIQFNLGINFSPSLNDRWFRKYKID
jgi:hypothetical protein